MAVKQILGKVTVTPKGEYSSDETYKRLDIVTSNGQSYIAKVDNTGVSVTDTNTWLQLVEKPEKGIDYFTEEDIAQLVSMVTDDSESEFNEYYNGKVSDFDSNASSKTSEFNSNYDEKVESFNTIFDTSTDNFDGNYETKLSAFNENASTQTSTFNSVVEQATSDFNSNASTLTETFNTNASEKTSAFNTNASEKTQEFNDNVDEKTEQITSQLDNYVQFDNYPSNEKAGVVKSHINGFQVSNDGNPNAAILSKEQYDTIENQYFISKGTLENIKDDYVESSTPVKNLNNSLKDITPKNNAEGTDNTFDDGIESPLFALGGDGQSIQDGTPTPDTPVEINSIEGSLEFACRGKNLFNFNKFVSDVSNVYKVEGTPENLTIKQNSGENGIYDIDFKENTQYKFSGKVFNSNANCSMRVIYTDGSNSSLFELYDNTTLNKNFSVTTIKGKTVLHILINIYDHGQTIELKDFMISQDLTDTNYVYQEPNEVTFNLNEEKLRSVGTVKDELVVDLDTGDYYKVENIGEEIFDGSKDENFVLYRLENTIKGFTIPLFISNPINQYLQSNYFRCKNTYYTWQGYGYFGINNTGTMWFQTDSNFSSVEEFKQWLSENNVKVYYQLATPTTVPLGTLLAEDLEKLKTFKGYNNVTVNTNLGLMNIRFTYGLDIKKYVDNKIAELSAQLIKGE